MNALYTSPDHRHVRVQIKGGLDGKEVAKKRIRRIAFTILQRTSNMDYILGEIEVGEAFNEFEGVLDIVIDYQHQDHAQLVAIAFVVDQENFRWRMDPHQLVDLNPS